MRVRKHRVAIVAAAIIGFGIAATASSIGSSPQPRRAAPGENSYRLSEFSIDYPVSSDDDIGEGGQYASVGFRAELTTGLMPGEVKCVVELWGQDEAAVGSVEFGMSILGSSTVLAPLPVSVSDRPASATGYCSGQVAGASTVTIRDLGIASDNGRTYLVGDIRWPSDQYPGEQFCTAVLVGSPGEESVVPFTFDPGEGSGVKMLSLPDGQIVPPSGVTCQPVAGMNPADLQG